MTFSLIIPTYNEKENICSLLDCLLETLEPHCEFEIIVVDDNSPDLTWKIVETYGSEDRRIRLIRRTTDKGLSRAVIQGFNEAVGSIIGVIDADLSHDHHILPEMISAVRDDNYDLAIGSRRIPGGGADKWPWYRKISSNIATTMAKIMLDITITDPMSGYFTLKKELFEQAKHVINPRGYKILLEIYVRSNPQRIKEIPYIFKDRDQGHSKMSAKVMIEYMQMLLRLRFK
ncbi:polyprenol monophosphomannose synthase [Acidobacteriota bacterium]